jgi:hypothetical protein
VKRYNVPTSVKVIATRYKIRQRKDLQVTAGSVISTVIDVNSGEVMHEHDAVNVLGLTDPDVSLILLESEMGNDRFKVTLVHETLHAIFAEAGLRDLLAPDAEESIVKRVSPILYQVLKDNPRVYTFLTGRRLW